MVPLRPCLAHQTREIGAHNQNFMSARVFPTMPLNCTNSSTRRFTTPPRLLGVAFLLLCTILNMFPGQASAQPLDNNAMLLGLLNAQTNLQTWEADFVQTRCLKALTQPLTATGHVWFAAPNRFRWELGQPPQTIAVRQTEQLLVIYPRLKRVERYPLDSAKAGPW